MIDVTSPSEPQKLVGGFVALDLGQSLIESLELIQHMWFVVVEKKGELFR